LGAPQSPTPEQKNHGKGQMKSRPRVRKPRKTKAADNIGAAVESLNLSFALTLIVIGKLKHNPFQKQTKKLIGARASSDRASSATMIHFSKSDCAVR